MSKSATPTDDDLLVFLQSAGMLDNPLSAQQELIDLETAASAGVGEFERRTGYVPFLAGAAQTRTYRGDAIQPFCDGYWLKVNSGLLSVSAVSIDGNTQAVGTQYTLEPADAANTGRPYTDVRFRYYGGNSYFSTISITGVFGYGLTIPDDAWRGMLIAGALEVLTESSGYLGGQRLKSYEEKGVREEFTTGTIEMAQSKMEARLTQIVSRYKRQTVY